MIKYLILAGTMALTACGGGGGGAAPATAAPAAPAAVAVAAEGNWGGTFGSGSSLVMVILENGRTFGAAAATSGTQLELLSATTTVSGASTTTTGTSISTGSGAAPRPATLTGNLVAKTSLSGTTTSGGTFNTTFSANIPYDAAPPALTTLAGSYAGNVGTKNTAPTTAFTFTLSATGVLNASSGPCVITGSVKPRASGKNVYDVATTLTGCDFTSADGVLLFNPTLKTIVIMAMVPGDTDGMVFAGAKP